MLRLLLLSFFFSPDVLVTDAQKAFDLHASGEYESACELYRSVIDRLESSGTLSESEVAPKALNGLASVYQDMGRFEDAERTYRRALNLYIEDGRQRDPLALHVLANLATVYFETRQFGRLREVARSSGRLLEGVPDEAPAARLYHLLSLTARLERRYDEAERWLVKAVAILRRLPGHHEISLADTLNSFGALEFERRRNAKALAYFQEAVQLYRAAQLNTGPMHGATLANLACVYLRLGRTADADVAHARAVEMIRETLGPNHPHVARTMFSYAAILEEKGQKRRAKDLRKRAEAIQVPQPPVVDITEFEQ